MPERAAELNAALEKTTEAVKAVDALAGKVQIHQQTLRRGKVAFWVAAIGLVLDMTLTVLVGWGLFGVNHNQDRINELQTAMQAQTDQNRSAQCAMVTLFLQFEPRTTTNPSYTDVQRAEQVQAYQTLHQIGRDLGCANQ